MYIYDVDQRVLAEVRLTTDWMQFTYPSETKVLTKYDDDGLYGDAGGDVYFREAEHFAIEYPRKWNIWSCRYKNEDQQRCSDVRKGNFYWGGSYLVRLIK